MSPNNLRLCTKPPYWTHGVIWTGLCTALAIWRSCVKSCLFSFLLQMISWSSKSHQSPSVRWLFTSFSPDVAFSRDSQSLLFLKQTGPVLSQLSPTFCEALGSLETMPEDCHLLAMCCP